MIGRVAGLVLDRLANLANCVLKVAPLIGGQAEEVQGVRMSGQVFEDILEDAPGRPEASGLQVLDADVQGVRSVVETHQQWVQWSSRGRPRRRRAVVFIL